MTIDNGGHMEEKIKAGQFKAECLKIMDRVKRTRRRITITKRNVPIAQLVPLEKGALKAYGKMKGSIHIIGEIIHPIDEVWNADS
jgi:prevent-host-death family protein